MRIVSTLSVLALALLTSSCDELATDGASTSEDNPQFTMPDVTGEKLDVAYEKIESAGFDDKDAVTIEGGGALGVIVESNWTVCSQVPEAGAEGTEAPTLAVERSCGDDDNTSTDDPSDGSSESPSDTASETPAETPTPEVPTVVTARNSPYFKQILAVEDYCDPVIDKFAEQYAGVSIAFDGSVAAAGGGNYLVSPGDDGEMSISGPSFQFDDASGGPLRVNDLVRITATVDEFDQDQCLFRIDDVDAVPR